MAYRRPGRRRRRKIPPPPATPPIAIPPPLSTPGAKPVVPPAAVPQAVAPGATGQAVPPARPPAGATTDPLIGRVLGRCRIEEQIGVGRTAVVYRALHEALHTNVAVKILLPSAVARPEIVKNFETEARALARIDNENVIKIYDVGAEGDLHYIVMELLNGEPVLDLVDREGPMDVMDALRVVRQAANGLQAAHARGILHRDIKPQNLVLLEDGTVKVVDFGLAGDVEGDVRRVGTPHFMAPETCAKGEAEERSDIYSLGITLYHLLVGQPPYAGQEVASILKSHMRGEALRPERRRMGLPREVADLVRATTRRDPSERPTAAGVLEALDAFGGEALLEKTTLRRRRSRMRAHIAASRERSTAGRVIFIALLLGVVAVLAWLVLKKSRPPSEPPPRANLPAASTPTPTVPTPPPSRTEPPPPVETPPPREPISPAPAAAEPPATERDAKGRAALKDVEAWARANWKSPADDKAVMDRYAAVAREFSGTRAAEVAEQRRRDIASGAIPAHPDLSFATPEEIEAIRLRWEEAQPEFEQALQEHLYFKASNLVPKPAVQSGEAGLATELTFWRTCTEHLNLFKTSLARLAPQLPESRRQVEVDGQSLLVKSISDQKITVVEDGREQSLPWTAIPPTELAGLARRAFQDADPSIQIQQMAFTFAHRLWNEFWAADLDLGISGPGPEIEAWRAAYKSHVEARKQ